MIRFTSTQTGLWFRTPQSTACPTEAVDTLLNSDIPSGDGHSTTCDDPLFGERKKIPLQRAYS